jgi:two-component system NtrC family sensor kinase
VEDQNFTRIKEIKKFLNQPQSELVNTAFKARPVRLTKSPFEKKLLSTIKVKGNEIERKNSYKEELRTLLESITEIGQLPQAILSLPVLNSFDSCHVLVHEKGKPVGQNYLASFGKTEDPKLIGVQSFNTLYNLVKKSKSKTFSQTPNLKEDLSLVGHFLARELDLKNYSVIYIVSRHSFLSPSPEEQIHFQQLAQFLNPLLIKILDKEKNELKKEILKKSLENFPERIAVKQGSQFIFSNQGPTSSENLNLMIFPLENEGYTMELSNFSKEQISTELYHSQRVSLLGELLNTLQHELSNPLFGLNLTSTILESETTDPETKIVLSEIAQNANRSQTIIKNFSNLYNDQDELKQINIHRFIEEVMTLTKSETKEIQKIIECVGFNSDEELNILTNPICLTQIIFNLIINSAQAIKGTSMGYFKNRIIIRLTRLEKTLEIAVIDDGPGVKTEHISTIFQAFFTTKEAGTGLGLSICQNLASQLGSKLEFKNNSPFPGATFSINLPLN